MNVSEIYADIAEAIAAPVASVDHQTMTAKQVAAAKAENASRLAKVKDCIVRLTAAHPDVLLRALGKLEIDLVVQNTTLDRAANNIVRAAGQPPEVERLTEAIKQNMRHETSTITAGLAECGGTTEVRSLPTRYIRADAEKFFRAEIDAAEVELKDIHRRFPRTQHSWPSGRISERIRQLQATIADWPKTQKLARLGERVFSEREERRRLEAERSEVQQRHRETALAI